MDRDRSPLRQTAFCVAGRPVQSFPSRTVNERWTVLTHTHFSLPFTNDCQSKARFLQSGTPYYCTLFVRIEILALRSSIFTSTIQCPPETEVKSLSRHAGKSNEFNAFQFVFLRAFLRRKVIRRHYFSLPLRIRCDNTDSCGRLDHTVWECPTTSVTRYCSWNRATLRSGQVVTWQQWFGTTHVMCTCWQIFIRGVAEK